MAPPFRDFLAMEWVQNKTTRSPIRAPEVIRRDVKHMWIFLNLQNFIIMYHILDF